MLRILGRTARADAQRRILALSRDIGAAHLDHAELVAADPPVENFGRAGLGVEAPSAMLADQRDRQRPSLFADDQGRLVRAVAIEPVRFVIRCNVTCMSSSESSGPTAPN
jgi:hypothetical protein